MCSVCWCGCLHRAPGTADNRRQCSNSVQCSKATCVYWLCGLPSHACLRVLQARWVEPCMLQARWVAVYVQRGQVLRGKVHACARACLHDGPCRVSSPKVLCTDQTLHVTCMHEVHHTCIEQVCQVKPEVADTVATRPNFCNPMQKNGADTWARARRYCATTH